jgi:hypothetical protein
MSSGFRTLVWCCGSLLAGAALAVACTGANSSGVGSESCTAGQACGGGSILACTTTDGAGQCASLTYKVAGKSFTCASCSDCQKAVTDAVATCGTGAPGNGSTGGGETCAPGPSCANGTVQACTTKDANGACVGVTYKTVGQSFTCKSCTDCAQAALDAANACVVGPTDGGGNRGNDSGRGGTCVSPCHSDLECQNTCPPLSNGGVTCCDTSVGACFAIGATTCPVTRDSGPPPPY